MRRRRVRRRRAGSSAAPGRAARRGRARHPPRAGRGRAARLDRHPRARAHAVRARRAAAPAADRLALVAARGRRPAAARGVAAVVRGRRLRLSTTRRATRDAVALAVAAPVLWCSPTCSLTGDPLFSLTGTRALAEELGRPRSAPLAPLLVPRLITSAIGLPVHARRRVRAASRCPSARRRASRPCSPCSLLALATFVRDRRRRPAAARPLPAARGGAAGDPRRGRRRPRARGRWPAGRRRRPAWSPRSRARSRGSPTPSDDSRDAARRCRPTCATLAPALHAAARPRASRPTGTSRSIAYAHRARAPAAIRAGARRRTRSSSRAAPARPRACRAPATPRRSCWPRRRLRARRAQSRDWALASSCRPSGVFAPAPRQRVVIFGCLRPPAHLEDLHRGDLPGLAHGDRDRRPGLDALADPRASSG